MAPPGQPDLVEYCATTGPITSGARSHMVDAFDLSVLAPQPRLEVAYILQRCHEDRRIRVPPSIIRHVVGLLGDTGVTSLLDRPLDHWLGAVAARNWSDPSRTIGLLRYSHRHLIDLAHGIDIEAEYGGDVWVAARLGIELRRPAQIRLDTIAQPWLRHAVKRWARFRLGSGKAFGSVAVDVRAMVWFGRFLAGRRARHGEERSVTRDAIEAYMVWLGASHLVAHTKSTYLTCLRGFLDACRRGRWLGWCT